MKTLKTSNTIAKEVNALFSGLRTGADEFKKNSGSLTEKVKGADSKVSELMLLGLSSGMKPVEIGAEILAHEKDTLKHFEGTPRTATMKQLFANVKRVIPSLSKVIGKTDKGADIKGADLLKNAKGEIVPLQSVARKVPAVKKGIKAKEVVELSQALIDSALELAGEADWDRVLANQALAKVFADAKAKEVK